MAGVLGAEKEGEAALERRSLVSPTTAGLPLSHRLSIVYLAAPVVVWLVGWFEWWVGLPMAALLAAGLWGALSGSWRISLSLPIFVALLAALAWVLLTQYGGLWKSDGDLETHFALLRDLGRGRWPTYFTDYWNDNPPLLSYYIGLNIVPGLVGRWLGSAALSWAFPLWISVGVGLLICLFIRGLSTLRATLIAIAIIAFFSGMDALELVLQLGPQNAFDAIRGGEIFVERQRTKPLDVRLYPLYYPNSYFLWYAPQHLIAGGLVSLIIIQSRHQPRFKAVSFLVIAICLFWSPISALGLLPLAATLIVRKEVRPFLKWPNVLVAPLLVGLIALHLNNDMPSDFGWLWQYYNDHAQMLIDLMWLYLTEFVLLAFVLWRMYPPIIKEPVFVVILSVLTVAPWFIYHPYPFYIMTKGTVPVLIALAYLTTRVVIRHLPETVSRPQTAFSSASSSGRGIHTSLVAMIAIGGLTPLIVFLKSSNYPNTVYEQSERTLLVHEYPWFATERSMTNVPVFFQKILQKHDRKGLSLEDPIIHSKYDIYLQEQENALIYLNRNCIPNSERNTSFFLHIYPSDNNDLPHSYKRIGYEIKESTWELLNRWTYTQTDHNDCIAIFGLPDYGITHIVAGQYTPYLGIDWSVEYQFDADNNAIDKYINRFNPNDTYQAYYSYYQSTTANEPIIRSSFEVYLMQLHQKTLIYTKDNCTSSSVLYPFFLHVIPTDINDLPAQRLQLGFDNYDFEFEDRGVIFDNKCLAVVPIPDYDIAAIRTGQWNPIDGQRFWQDEITIDR